jgi:retinol dehydrogenase-12
MGFRQAISEYSPPKPNFTEADLPDLSSRSYLITGGASGIGKELARILYSANATVYIAGRSAANIDKARAEIEKSPSSYVKTQGKTSSGSIEAVHLDLSDLPTIKPAVDALLETLKAKNTYLDAIFFNAGVMTPPAGSKTTQGYELQWGTNVVGHFLLQRLLLPFVLASAKQSVEPIRLVWTSSDGHAFGPGPDGINFDDLNGPKLGSFTLYGQSKAGNVVLSHEVAKRYGDQGVISVSLNPGHLKSDLQRNSPAILNKVIGPLLLYDTRYGALTELFAGLSKDITIEKNGSYIIPWGRFGQSAKKVRDGMDNRDTGKKLWDLLEKETEPYI